MAEKIGLNSLQCYDIKIDYFCVLMGYLVLLSYRSINANFDSLVLFAGEFADGFQCPFYNASAVSNLKYKYIFNNFFRQCEVKV